MTTAHFETRPVTIELPSDHGIALGVLEARMREVEAATNYHQCSSTWRACLHLVNAVNNGK